MSTTKKKNQNYLSVKIDALLNILSKPMVTGIPESQTKTNKTSIILILDFTRDHHIDHTVEY